MEADELAYLDQLHAQLSVKLGRRNDFNKFKARDEAKAKFIEIVLRDWPMISAILPEHDHSL
jgi:hypothetical protein